MARITEDNCVECETCTGSLCRYYNEQTYYTCDECGESDVNLYWDGKKMYCAGCIAQKHFDDFHDYCRDMMLEEYAEEFANENYESVNQEGDYE